MDLEEAKGTFPCNACGACCRLGEDPVLRAAGWLLSNGDCKHYCPETKLCRIYERRPWGCMIDVRWAGVPLEEKKAFCNRVHQKIYGSPWEQEGKCEHERS